MPTINKTVDNAFMQREVSRSFQNRKPLAVNSPEGTSAQSSSLIGTENSAKEKDFISEMMGSRTERNHTVRDYDEDKKAFQSGLHEKMSSLKTSGSNLKSLKSVGDKEIGIQTQAAGNKAVENPAAGQGQTAGMLGQKEQGGRTNLWQRDVEEKETASERVRNAQNEASEAAASGTRSVQEEAQVRVREDVEAVRGFVQDYNDTVSYLNEGRDMSRGMSRLADSFEDSGSLSESLSQIGVSLRSDGGLEVNESKLTEALTERPDRVEAALGENGMAGRMDRKLDMVSQQAGRLYPSIKTAVGGESRDAAKEMYAGNSQRAANAYSDLGSLYQVQG